MKLSADWLEAVIDRYLTIRTNFQEWKPGSVTNYRIALRHFITWYRDHIGEFDQSRLVAVDWIKRAKTLGDNEQIYTAVGNIVRQICDIVEAAQAVNAFEGRIEIAVEDYQRPEVEMHMEGWKWIGWEGIAVLDSDTRELVPMTVAVYSVKVMDAVQGVAGGWWIRMSNPEMWKRTERATNQRMPDGKPRR